MLSIIIIVIILLSLLPTQPSSPRCSPEYIATLQEEWRQVFIVAAEVYIAGAILYIILGSGKVQPWAVDKQHDVITTSSINTGSGDESETETAPLLQSH